MKKAKKETEKKKISIPKGFNEKMELVKNFRPKKYLLEDQKEYVWTISN